jgi:hypothetical protein
MLVPMNSHSHSRQRSPSRTPLPYAWVASPQPHSVPVVHPRRSWVLRGCSDAIDHAARMGPDGTLVRHQPGRNTCVLDWRARVGPDSTKGSGLLIRGFGVRVPGGAPFLTWVFFLREDRPVVFLRPGANGVLTRPSVLRCRGTIRAVASAASRATSSRTVVYVSAVILIVECRSMSGCPGGDAGHRARTGRGWRRDGWV